MPYQRLDALPFDESEEQHGKLINLKKFPKGHPVKLFRLVNSVGDKIASMMLSNGATLAEVAYQLEHAPGPPMTRRYAKFIPAAQQSITHKAQEAMNSLLEPQGEIFAETSWASL